MKICSKCKNEYPLTNYRKYKQTGDKLHPWCRACLCKNSQDWRKNNLEKSRANEAAWLKINRERKRATDAAWHKANPEKARAVYATWSSKYPERRRAKNATRRANELSAVPPWFSELDKFVVKEASSLALDRERCTGIKWHVDHVIPIKGKFVCGLHVHNNIAVIPAHDNHVKCNKFGSW